MVIDATGPLGANATYTIAATGFLADIQPLALVDDTAATGQAKVRFVHTSPDAAAVDVAVTDGPVLFGGMPFRGATQDAGVDGGSYDLEVRVAGTSGCRAGWRRFRGTGGCGERERNGNGKMHE